MTPVERTLLKLLLTEETYIEKIAELPELLESEFAVSVYRLAAEEYEKNRFVDRNRILDSLPEGDAAKLQEIIEQVIIGGNVEKVFEDCVRTWEENRLEKEEQRLITLLSMADEEDNQERIAELTDQLIKVQKKRKTSSRGI